MGTPGTSISGTPTYATYLTNFTVQVQDSLGNKATRVLNLPLNSGQPSLPSVASPIVLVCDVSGVTSGAINDAMRTEVEQLVSGLHSADEFDIIVHNDRFSGGYVAMWGTTLPATSGNVASALAWIQGSNFNAAGNVGNSMHDAWEFAHTTYTSVITPSFLFHSTGTSAQMILNNLPGWGALAPNGKALFVAFTPDAATKQFGQDAAALVGGAYIEA